MKTQEILYEEVTVFGQPDHQYFEAGITSYSSAIASFTKWTNNKASGINSTAIVANIATSIST